MSFKIDLMSFNVYLNRPYYKDFPKLLRRTRKNPRAFAEVKREPWTSLRLYDRPPISVTVPRAI